MISEVDIRDMKDSIRGSVLKEADSIVNGPRAQVYGPPEKSFDRVAALWSAFMLERCTFTGTDVAALLALLKMARLANSPDHRDSWVDLAGYAACGAECGLKK
jgi:hypothetical protein